MIDKLMARWRAFIPLSCLQSPRSDILSGPRRWRWLYLNRKRGCLVDPSTEIRADVLDLSSLEETLVISNGVAIDKGCILWMGVHAGHSGSIRIRKGAYIGPYTFIGSCHTLSIGENSMIGANGYLITVNHKTGDRTVPYGQQGYAGDDIIIGDNVWLGSHVVVLPGVTIGDGAIVGAGAVVTRDIPPGETWAGVPARRIKGSE